MRFTPDMPGPGIISISLVFAGLVGIGAALNETRDIGSAPHWAPHWTTGCMSYRDILESEDGSDPVVSTVRELLGGISHDGRIEMNLAGTVFSFSPEAAGASLAYANPENAHRPQITLPGAWTGQLPGNAARLVEDMFWNAHLYSRSFGADVTDAMDLDALTGEKPGTRITVCGPRDSSFALAP